MKKKKSQKVKILISKQLKTTIKKKATTKKGEITETSQDNKDQRSMLMKKMSGCSKRLVIFVTRKTTEQAK